MRRLIATERCETMAAVIAAAKPSVIRQEESMLKPASGTAFKDYASRANVSLRD